MNNPPTFVTAGFAIVLLCGYAIGRVTSPACPLAHYPRTTKRDEKGRFTR